MYRSVGFCWVCTARTKCNSASTSRYICSAIGGNLQSGNELHIEWIWKTKHFMDGSRWRSSLDLRDGSLESVSGITKCENHFGDQAFSVRKNMKVNNRFQERPTFDSRPGSDRCWSRACLPDRQQRGWPWRRCQGLHPSRLLDGDLLAGGVGGWRRGLLPPPRVLRGQRHHRPLGLGHVPWQDCCSCYVGPPGALISFFYIFAMKFQIYSTLLQVIKIISRHQAEVSTVPFFWTVQFGKSIRYAGHGHGWEDVIYQARFVFFFCKNKHNFLQFRKRRGRCWRSTQKETRWSPCWLLEKILLLPGRRNECPHIYILRIFLYFVDFLHKLI